MKQRRYIIVPFPAQGYINPSLQFSKRLIGTGAEVVFVIPISVHRRIMKNKTSTSTPDGLSFFLYSDSFDDGFKPGDDLHRYLSELRRGSKQAVSDLINSSAKHGRPVTCVFYSLCVLWIAETARELHVPSALLWVEPATLFCIYYYFFHGYEDEIKNNINDPSYSLELPGLPLKLTGRDLPSLMEDTKSENNWVQINMFREQFEVLDKETKTPRVLVNSFGALEPEAFVSIGDNQVKLFGIGPLIQSSFSGEKDHEDQSKTSFRGDLYQIDSNDNYIEWMSSKPERSVIYVSFGSFYVLPKPQMEEIAGGLLDYGRPFLWVITERQREEGKKEEDELSCREELEKLGRIVSWCSQLDVLSNTSLGCFVTHCGWNSTLESLVCGVPMVAFPRWLDQGTNAKLIEDVWKTGLRVKANKEGIVERDEIKRCLELVMGDDEIGRNAKKLKDLDRDALKAGGTFDKNFKAFLDEIDQEKGHFLD
ncbi:phloretin 4'-O-glucosyltransferase [Ziziphus jujuba]|uniref:Glycosyltransferase n=1 Tax=Ziziphus jujuba TaxID=326968 RepID=A0ABM4A5L2_ZIZJJ|nr:phloretin 4'-O-glucosyltransferase [Ziziphus jujuba]